MSSNLTLSAKFCASKISSILQFHSLIQFLFSPYSRRAKLENGICEWTMEFLEIGSALRIIADASQAWLRSEFWPEIAPQSAMAFPFENLEVYRRSLQFVVVIESLAERITSRPFRDQLTRAALSIPLNIAEGNGRWHLADKRQFFWIARGSVFECVPILEILKIRNQLPASETADLRSQLEVLGKMLTKLIQAHSDREAGKT